MHLTSDQTLKVTLVHSTHSPLPSDSQFSPLPASQNRQSVQPTQQQPKDTPSTHLLNSCFRHLAYIGQIGSALIALALAVELASSLTVVMIILGIFWVGCEQFGSVDSESPQ
jgi:predicted small integral membrane protein